MKIIIKTLLILILIIKISTITLPPKQISNKYFEIQIGVSNNIIIGIFKNFSTISPFRFTI